MDNVDNKLRRVSELRSSEENNVIRQTMERSKTKLTQIIEKKFTTTFIGALSYIEQEFGHLWGRDKAPSNRTTEEKQWYDKWERLRTSILNNGNNQARAVLNELRQYKVKWDGYKTTLRSKE
jgi:hypothetical protein